MFIVNSNSNYMWVWIVNCLGVAYMRTRKYTLGHMPNKFKINEMLVMNHKRTVFFRIITYILL